MKIDVLFFSVLKDATGVESTPWEVEQGHTLEDLLESLFQRWPALKTWDGSLLFAMNQVYVPRSTTLVDKAEVAIMPPVQGG